MGRLLEGTKAERFEFIRDNDDLFPVRFLCQHLDVSFQGFYQWKQRQLTPVDDKDSTTIKKITAIYMAHKGNYGSPRVHAELRRQGEVINHKRVARLMRKTGLVGRAGRLYRRKPLPVNPCIAVGNKQLEEGKPKMAHQQWAGDITYLTLNGEWRYLAVVMDLYSRKIVGWSLSKKRGTSLTLKALYNAERNLKNTPSIRLFHSDRGAEYGSNRYQKGLKRLGIMPSMNRPQKMNDNVYVETFFQSLKTECIKGVKFNTDKELRLQLKWYLDVYYNQQRIHSSLGFKTPVEYEKLCA